MLLTRRQFLRATAKGSAVLAVPLISDRIAKACITEAATIPYLEDLEQGEIELARIYYASVLGEEASVCVQKEDDHYIYRVYGVYDGEGMVYQQPFYRTEEPVNLGGLISLIDGTEYPDDIFSGGLVVSGWECAYSSGDVDKDEALKFVCVSSGYYPELISHYEQVAEQWMAEHEEEDEEEDEGDDW